MTAWIGEVRLPDHLHLSRPRADRRGAVMGSKNLKSIVVRGTGKVAVKDLEGLKKLTQWGAKNVRVNVAMAGLQKYGTAETVLVQQSVGALPTHNGDSGVFDQAEEISGERMYDTILREGSGRNEDKLPKKLFKPLTGGPSDGLHVTEEQMEQALDRYYAMAGWDKATAMPTDASLDRYGLDWATYTLGADPLPHTGGLNLPAGSTASK